MRFIKILEVKWILVLEHLDLGAWIVIVGSSDTGDMCLTSLLHTIIGLRHTAVVSWSISIESINCALRPGSFANCFLVMHNLVVNLRRLLSLFQSSRRIQIQIG